MRKALNIVLIGLIVLATVGPAQADDNAFQKAGKGVVKVIVWPFKMIGNGFKKLFGKS